MFFRTALEKPSLYFTHILISSAFNAAFAASSAVVGVLSLVKLKADLVFFVGGATNDAFSAVVLMELY